MKSKENVGKMMMFYCVKGKHKVQSKVEKIVTKKGRAFAVSSCSKHGITMYRILGKE